MAMANVIHEPIGRLKLTCLMTVYAQDILEDFQLSPTVVWVIELILFVFTTPFWVNHAMAFKSTFWILFNWHESRFHTRSKLNTENLLSISRWCQKYLISVTIPFWATQSSRIDPDPTTF